MKLKKTTHSLKIYKFFVVCFSVLLAVFSMFINGNLNNIEKIDETNFVPTQLSPYDQNIIIQKPKEEKVYGSKLASDIFNNNTSSSEIYPSKIQRHTHNPLNVARTLWVSMDYKLYAWHGARVSFSSVDFQGHFDKLLLELKTNKNKTISYIHNENNYVSGSQYGWSGFETTISSSISFAVNLPPSQFKDEAITSFSLTPWLHVSGNGTGGLNTQLQILNLKFEINNNVVENFPVFNSAWWKATSFSSYNQSPQSKTITPIYIGKKDYYDKTNIKYKKIYMDPRILKNKVFTQQELKNLIHLSNNNWVIPSSNLIWKQIKLDRNKSLIHAEFKKIIGTNPNVSFDNIKLTIPITTLNFDYLMEMSILSSSYFEHLPNGETRYHSKKPTTRVKLSEGFIKSLKVVTGVNKLISKISKDNWGFVANDKQIAIAKIRDLSINEENYDNIWNAYKNTHDSNILNNLLPPQEIPKYLSNNNFGTASYEDYLYVLKNFEFQFDYGVSKLHTKKVSLRRLLNGINLKIDDADIAKASANRSTWNMKVKNFKIVSRDPSIIFESNNLKIDIPNKPLQNYDLKLSYSDLTQTEIIHKFLFQAKGLDISQNISFVMEDGTILDQEFRVITTSPESKLKQNEYAYIATRYWTTFSTGQKEYITLEKQNNGWYSPKYKQFITQLDSKFNPKKIEYLFNQNLQLIINPYTSSPITSTTPQNFGIKQVIDEVDGIQTVLEDWNDGRWSHATNQNGHALYDGIFGSDINGIMDGHGLLTTGQHHINITLQNSSFTGLRNNFIITIDKDPVKTKVKATNGELKSLSIKNDKGNIKKLYSSSGPINISVADIDIRNVTGQFIDQQGNWYKLPIKIISKLVDGHWVQTITSTIDYAGFAEITITDQAGNSKELFFWLQPNENTPTAEFDFLKNSFIDNKERKFNGNKLFIANKSVEGKISSPLVTAVKIQKQNLSKGEWKQVANANDYIKKPFVPNVSSKKFARTIDSSTGSLKFAGDELKPFLQNSSGTWPMTNEEYEFKNVGLYKISIQTRIIGHELIELDLYVGNKNSKILDSLFTQDEGNFEQLPSKEVSSKNLPNDKAYKLTSELHLNIPTFIIKSYSVEYSLPWYSDFIKIDDPKFNFKRQGKYKVHILDIYGNKHEYQILVINKGMSVWERKQKGYSPVYGKPGDDKTAFWKGENVWNYWRYEDKDHAKWEHDEFIKKAIDGGMSKKDAEALYKHLKQNPAWGGDGNGINGKDFNPKKLFRKWKDSELALRSNQKLSKASKIGIIVGVAIGGVLISSAAAWMIYKRIKGRRIK